MQGEITTGVEYEVEIVILRILARNDWRKAKSLAITVQADPADTTREILRAAFEALEKQEDSALDA